MSSATTDARLQFWDMPARLQPACMIATGAHDMALWPLDASQVKVGGQRIRIEGLAAPIAMGDLATVTFIDDAGAADPVPCPVSCPPGDQQPGPSRCSPDRAART